MVNIVTKSKGRILPLDCCSLSDLLGDTLKLDNEEFQSDGESPACRQALERRQRQRIMQYVPHVEIGVCSTARYITMVSNKLGNLHRAWSFWHVYSLTASRFL